MVWSNVNCKSWLCSQRLVRAWLSTPHAHPCQSSCDLAYTSGGGSQLRSLCSTDVLCGLKTTTPWTRLFNRRASTHTRPVARSPSVAPYSSRMGNKTVTLMARVVFRRRAHVSRKTSNRSHTVRAAPNKSMVCATSRGFRGFSRGS